MDNSADFEVYLTEEQFIKDNAKFKRGQRVHTWSNNNKPVVGKVVDIDIDEDYAIYYDVNVGDRVLHFIPEYMLRLDGFTSVDAALLLDKPF